MMSKDRMFTRVAKAMGAAHIALYRRTGGRIGGRFRGAPCLLLTVTGRKSGQPRTAPLMYGRDGDDYVIVASSFGRIGMKADELVPGQPRAGAQSGGKRYEVELPLLDANGGAVGALTVGWPLRKGDDGKAFVSQAEKIRDELRARIPSLEKLVELDP